MWFGTFNGLNRFDGYRFRVYRPEANNPNSLGGVYITALFEDRSGGLWIGVDQGLDRFDPVTEIFTHFHSNPADPATLAGAVEHIAQDRDGMLWLATRNGLDRLDPASGRFTHYRNDPNNPRSLSSNDVRYVLEGKQGTLWVATAMGLEALDHRSGGVTRYPTFQDPPLDRIYEDRSGTLWVGSTRAGGVASLDPKTGLLTRYAWFDEKTRSARAGWCYAIHEDRYGMLWLATRPDGLVKFDRQRGQFTRYLHDPGRPDSLNSSLANSLAEDNEGGIWVGTSLAGVNRFSSEPSPFTIYWEESGNPNSLNRSYVYSVFEDSQEILWIATPYSEPARSEHRTVTRFTGTIGPMQPPFTTCPFSASLKTVPGFSGSARGEEVLTDSIERADGSRLTVTTSRIRDLSSDVIWTCIRIGPAPCGWGPTMAPTASIPARSVLPFIEIPKTRLPAGFIARLPKMRTDRSARMFEWGVQRLDVRTGKIVTYRNDPKLKGSREYNLIVNA